MHSRRKCADRWLMFPCSKTNSPWRSTVLTLEFLGIFGSWLSGQTAPGKSSFIKEDHLHLTHIQQLNYSDYDKLTSEKSLSKCSQRANSRLMRSWKLWILMRVCLGLWRHADVMCFTCKKNLNEKKKFCVFEYNTCTLQTLKQYNCKWKLFPFSLTHTLCFAVCTVLWQKPSFVPGMNEGMCVCVSEREILLKLSGRMQATRKR